MIYSGMVNDWLIPSLKRDKVFKYKLMQDGAKIHTSKHTMEVLRKKAVKLLPDWPPYSPDLNVIENVWSMLKKSLKKKYRSEGLPKDNDAFFKDASFFYKELCNKHVDKLFSSMEKRLQMVVKQKGERIKY